jgi:hypothetical protein
MIDKLVKHIGRPSDAVLNRACVGCGRMDSFAYKGSIITGTHFAAKQVTEREPFVVGIFVDPPQADEVVVTGGELKHTTKRVPFQARKRGLICRQCAANYRTIEIKHKDGSVTHEPVVKVESEIIGTTLLPIVEKVRGELSYVDAVSAGVQSPTPRSTSSSRSSSRTLGNKEDNQWLNVGRKQRR